MATQVVNPEIRGVNQQRLAHRNWYLTCNIAKKYCVCSSAGASGYQRQYD
ncbi:MAG: hypothetical protein V2A77_11980 [Pseudomonadota bacterium]